MHDVDRTTLEYGSELSEYGESPLASEQYEFAGEYPGEYSGEYSGEQGTVLGEILGEAAAESTFESTFEGGYQELPLPEIMEDELAAELLEVGNEQELDHFLGSLISKAVGTIRRAVNTPIGKALGGVLKQVAKKALPIAGGALGTFIGGPAGGLIGSKLASLAGDAFGLEWEGLSPEDRDFEMARRYVRFAGHAAKRAAAAPPHVDPQTVVKDAVVDAAKKFAPGLLTPTTGVGMPSAAMPGPPPTTPPFQTGQAYGPPTAAVYPPIAPPLYPSPGPVCPSCGTTPARHRRQGKWIRRGRHIVLLGV
jgi:hypothetical protein